VIPESSANRERVTISSRENFVSALSRVALIVNDKANSVVLSFNKNRVIITSSAPNVGEAKEDVAVKYGGKEINVAFNPEFLIEPLKTVESDEVYFELSDELTASTIKCGTGFMYVIMPMRVK